MSGSEIIDVTFIDVDTQQEFLKLKYPLRRVPAVESMLKLGKEEWLVVDVQQLAAGAVKVFLRKVLKSIDPSTILFSLPTVADEIPEEVPGDQTGALRLHEDDWLQLELVPREVVSHASTDLLAIRAVLANERQGAGFKQLHVRKGLAAPFAGHPLALRTLSERFGAEHRVAYLKGKGVLKDCFAFLLPSGASLYGQQRGGQIVAVGLTTRDPSPVEGLMLVDWIAGEVR